MSDNEQTNKNRKTLADIVAMVRRAAQYYEGEAEKSEGPLRESFELSAANYRTIANLVEAAWKREKAEIEADALAVGGIVESARHRPGNAAAMREALESCLDFIMRLDRAFNPFMQNLLEDAIAKANTALSAPPRNCDVGTAEEQAERMRLYCNSHGEDESGCFRCEKCPFLTDERCELAWAQMPYEAQEGGAK